MTALTTAQNWRRLRARPGVRKESATDQQKGPIWFAKSIINLTPVHSIFLVVDLSSDSFEAGIDSSFHGRFPCQAFFIDEDSLLTKFFSCCFLLPWLDLSTTRRDPTRIDWERWACSYFFVSSVWNSNEDGRDSTLRDWFTQQSIVLGWRTRRLSRLADLLGTTVGMPSIGDYWPARPKVAPPAAILAVAFPAHADFAVKLVENFWSHDSLSLNLFRPWIFLEIRRTGGVIRADNTKTAPPLKGGSSGNGVPISEISQWFTQLRWW